MKKSDIGREKELYAAHYLESKGYKVVAKNYRTKFGEIDIVARQGDILVFIEVRSRKDDYFGKPQESIKRQKREKIVKTAVSFLTIYTEYYSSVRFDVISVVGNDIEHIENAFWIDFDI